MKTAHPLALCCVLVLPAAQAGHGLINSFADVEWLPPPGTTPDQLTWQFDLAADAAALWLARAPGGQRALLYTSARERLAELDAMVRVGDGAAAARAVTAYRDVLDALEQTLQSAPSPADLRGYAEALLAHQYLLSTNYLDLPRASRGGIRPMLDLAAARYEDVAKRLPQGVRDALFFKEEEVRWSRDMAVAADEQGL